MSYFRLYFMDPNNGHIDRLAEFEAPDDDAALALVGEHIGPNPLELWCGSRKVQRIEASGAMAGHLAPEAATVNAVSVPHPGGGAEA